MAKILWSTSKDGLFEFSSLTAETVEDALEVMRTAFFKDEIVSSMLNVGQFPEAVQELEGLILKAMNHGVSLVAVDKTNGKVVAVSINKLCNIAEPEKHFINVVSVIYDRNKLVYTVKDDPEDLKYYEEYAKNCKHESSKALIQYMIDAYSKCDLFKQTNVDCLLEIMFMVTLPEYRAKGLGKRLSEITAQLGRCLMRGEMVKVPVEEGVTLHLEPVPKALSAICSSPVTRKIAKELDIFNLAGTKVEDVTGTYIGAGRL